ncbi:MAG: hypothetical protein ACM3IJ_04935 [Candidatus Levyibacteriota bacterium]
MDSHLAVAKIVGNADTSAWAQAYSAGKLHVLLSLSGQSETPVAGIGKESLEKLQREFFALDEKTLQEVQKAVETVTASMPEGLSYGLILATVVENVLYLIIANSGAVFLKRKEMVATIGVGEDGRVQAFSGKILPHDTIILLTEGALETISREKIEAALRLETPGEIAEQLAPLVHAKSTGTEAALIWKVIGPAGETEEEEIEEEIIEPSGTRGFPSLPFLVSGLKDKVFPYLLSLKKLDRKKAAVLVAIVLVLILVGSFFMQKGKQQDAQYDAALQKILPPAEQKYEDALAVMELNKEMGMQELQQIKSDVEKNEGQFPTGSKQAKQMQEFLQKIDSSLGSGPATASKIKLFFDPANNKDLPSVSYVSVKGGDIAAAGSQKGGIIKSDGSVSSGFDITNPRAITSDDKNIYVISSDGVDQITKSSGKSSAIISKQANPISIDTFGGNLYLLSKTDSTVYKYRPNDFNKEAYFASDTKLSSPSSIAIDSSIYIIDAGTIKKFTRGNPDSISYKGKALSSGSLIYTDVDYANLYVADSQSKAAYIVDKSGTVVSEFSLKGMKQITSIAADEKNRKIYIVGDNKIYSIDF